MATTRPPAPGPSNGFALTIAALVGAVSVMVVALLTLEVHLNIGFARDDSLLLERVRYHSSSRWVEGAEALVRLGDVETLIVVAIAIGLLLRWRGLHLLLCAAPLASLLVAGGFVAIMKATIGRSGPLDQFRFAASERGSFPSGHSADTMALAIGLAIVLVAVLVRRPTERVIVFGLALAFSVSVGLSTLVLGAHWPTDVVAGWALGLGAAACVATFAVVVTHGRPLAAARAQPRQRS